MAMTLGHAIDGFAANNSTTDVNDLDTIPIRVWDNPFEVVDSAFDWSMEDYEAWDINMNGECGEGGCGEGGNGSVEYSPEQSPCEDLRKIKPQNCPNPIPLPNGYAYGRDVYPGGSGIARLLYWIEIAENVDPSAREYARRGLSYHTIDIAQTFVTGNLANERLLLSVHTACSLQHAADQQNPLYTQNPFFNPEFSPMERNCLEVLEILQAEAGNPGFHGYFYDWMEREGVHLDDLGIPESLVEWLAPSNSLRLRHDTITANGQCAKWWIDAQANQCTF